MSFEVLCLHFSTIKNCDTLRSTLRCTLVGTLSVHHVSCGVTLGFSSFGLDEISVYIRFTRKHLRYHVTDVPLQPDSPPDNDVPRMSVIHANNRKNLQLS